MPAIGSHVFGGSDLGELTVAYPESALSEDHFSRANPKRLGAARAGDRAPDARIVTAEDDTATLFDLLYNPDGHSWGWRLLLDGGDGRTHAAPAHAADMVADSDWIHPLLVVADVAAASAVEGAHAIHDLDRIVHWRSA